ncbi:MAG: hypothetical protein EAZ96_21210, partial [Oscillatoriales cyanobacterium]
SIYGASNPRRGRAYIPSLNGVPLECGAFAWELKKSGLPLGTDLRIPFAFDPDCHIYEEIYRVIAQGQCIFV